jgi:hypothetical protein
LPLRLNVPPEETVTSADDGRALAAPILKVAPEETENPEELLEPPVIDNVPADILVAPV